MAVEDGAVLGHLLGVSVRASSNSTTGNAITAALRLYEQERKSRTTLNVPGAVANSNFYHLHDGPLQQERDAEIKTFHWENGYSTSWKWLDLKYDEKLLGHDAVKSADSAFVQLSSGNAIQA
jgi:salicylate hydroxylase